MPLEYSIEVVDLRCCREAERGGCVVGRVLLKIACMLTCRIRGLVVLMCRGDQAKDAELLVLRHEDAVLRRQSGQVRYEPAARPATVTDLDTGRIRRRLVLNGLINEYAPAA